MDDREHLIRDKYGGNRNADFSHDLKRLAEGEPLASVIGWIPFHGLRIYLDSTPLIPRPETEWWTELLITRARTFSYLPIGQNENVGVKQRIRILDLCAGSGAIGCAVLKKVPGAHVSFGEIDVAHEETIGRNVQGNELDEARADIRIGDLFAPFSDERFDIIATNPPYIPDARALPESVERYEPPEALRAGPDGLAFIRRIAKEAPGYLVPDGELWMEVDAEHAEMARALVAAKAKRTELYPDLYGRPRLVVGYY